MHKPAIKPWPVMKKTNYTVACKAANYYDGASTVDDNNE